jgi:hypothetical protein
MRRIRGIADAHLAPEYAKSEKDITIIEHPDGVVVNCYGYAVLLNKMQATTIANDILAAADQIKEGN